MRKWVFSDIEAEIERQERLNPDGYPATYMGVRVGLALAEDEVDEAKEAWAGCRCKCSTPNCDHADWTATHTEIVQAIAVLIRTAENMQPTDRARTRDVDTLLARMEAR